jgi:hypothetical protein
MILLRSNAYANCQLCCVKYDPGSVLSCRVVSCGVVSCGVVSCRVVSCLLFLVLPCPTPPPQIKSRSNVVLLSLLFWQAQLTTRIYLKSIYHFLICVYCIPIASFSSSRLWEVEVFFVCLPVSVCAVFSASLPSPVSVSRSLSLSILSLSLSRALSVYLSLSVSLSSYPGFLAFSFSYP